MQTDRIVCEEPPPEPEEPPKLPEWELFDLEKDTLEMNNVYHHPAYETVVTELTAELYRLKQEVGDEESHTDVSGVADVPGVNPQHLT